jgi:hypothetical protein
VFPCFPQAAERSRSPFAAQTDTLRVHPEPPAGGKTVQWLVETVEKPQIALILAPKALCFQGLFFQV